MNNLPPAQAAMLEMFQQHMAAEMTGDIETTMATMSDHPHLNHVPVMTGSTGHEGVRRFYGNHLVGKLFPPDVEIINVSRTIGEDQLVDELVVRFTHTVPVDWMLPGVPTTGKRVEVAAVVIIKFEGGKIAHEHIYWDQASVLVQLGLLDPVGLPVSGAESTRKVLDPQLPRHGRSNPAAVRRPTRHCSRRRFQRRGRSDGLWPARLSLPRTHTPRLT